MGLLGPEQEPALVIYTGLPGGGKSYQAAAMQRKWLEAGLPVISNLKVRQLPWSLWRWLRKVIFKVREHGPFYQLSREDCEQIIYNDKGEKTLRLLEVLKQVIDEHKGQKHILLVVDEAHLSFNSRNWKNFPEAVTSFLVQHRHMKVSILAISQNAKMIEGVFRMLAQEFRHHRNLCKDSTLGLFLWFFTSNLHLAYSQPNVNGEPCRRPKEFYDRSWFLIRSKNAATYDSGQLHNFDATVHFRRNGGKYARRVVWAATVALFIGIRELIATAGAGSSAVAVAVDPLDRGVGFIEMVSGTVLTMWDAEDGVTTFYDIELDDGTVRTVALNRADWGLQSNFDRVGTRINVHVPGPIYRPLENELGDGPTTNPITKEEPTV